ncbi:MAG: rhodanese-like domain-containing protein [Chromatiaceae bacterium]|nr:rhodanese-like domain-containing protein [Chromatiaceae bacterium]
MKKQIILIGMLSSLIYTSAQAYNTALASSFESFYGKLNQQALADSKLIIEPADLYKELIAKKQSFLVLDVRTDAEANMVNFTMPNSMHISLDNLFQKANLDRLPKDQKIVVACHSGVRSLLAAVGLKMLGFKNVHSLKGGIPAFADATTPKATLIP